jgi:hypothetical protein
MELNQLPIGKDFTHGQMKHWPHRNDLKHILIVHVQPDSVQLILSCVSFICIDAIGYWLSQLSV